MGRQTKFYGQSKKSMSGNKGATNYSQINRQAWHTKLFNFIKVRRKNNG